MLATLQSQSLTSVGVGPLSTIQPIVATSRSQSQSFSGNVPLLLACRKVRKMEKGISKLMAQNKCRSCHKIVQTFLQWINYDQNNSNSIPEEDIYFKSKDWITVKARVQMYEKKLEKIAKTINVLRMVRKWKGRVLKNDIKRIIRDLEHNGKVKIETVREIEATNSELKNDVQNRNEHNRRPQSDATEPVPIAVERKTDGAKSNAVVNNESKEKIKSQSRTKSPSAQETKTESGSRTRNLSVQRAKIESKSQTKSPSVQQTKTESQSQNRSPSVQKTKVESKSQIGSPSVQSEKMESKSQTKSLSAQRAKTESLSMSRGPSAQREKTESKSRTKSPSAQRAKIESKSQTGSPSAQRAKIESVSQTGSPSAQREKIESKSQTRSPSAQRAKIESKSQTRSPSAHRKKTESKSQTRSPSAQRAKIESKSQTRSPSGQREKTECKSQTGSPSAHREKIESKSRTESPSAQRAKMKSKSQTRRPSAQREKTESKSTKSPSAQRAKAESKTRVRSPSTQKAKTESQSCGRSPSAQMANLESASNKGVQQRRSQSKDTEETKRKTDDDHLRNEQKIVSKGLKGKNTSKTKAEVTVASVTKYLKYEHPRVKSLKEDDPVWGAQLNTKVNNENRTSTPWVEKTKTHVTKSSSVKLRAKSDTVEKKPKTPESKSGKAKEEGDVVNVAKNLPNTKSENHIHELEWRGVKEEEPENKVTQSHESNIKKLKSSEHQKSRSGKRSEGEEKTSQPRIRSSYLMRQVSNQQTGIHSHVWFIVEYYTSNLSDKCSR